MHVKLIKFNLENRKMGKATSGKDVFFFLGLNFNPNLRKIDKNGLSKILRKKESEVLELLCEKSPNPVSHADFFKYAWGGRCVTSQSIAQVIRTLRISIDDDTKSKH